MKKLVNIFFTLSLLSILLTGCTNAPTAQQSEAPKAENSKDTEVSLGEEKIPLIDDIIKEGTKEYDGKELGVEGFNDLAEHFNDLSSAFNEAGEKYAKEDIPQNDEIEEKMTIVSQKMEEIEKSIEEAKNYGDAVKIVKEIEAIESDLTEITEGIGK